MLLVVSLTPEQIAGYTPTDVVTASIGGVNPTPIMDVQRDSGAFILLDALLQNHVSAEGTVNYKAIKSDPTFERCISTFRNMAPEDSWSKVKKMSFWINVYNVFTIKLMVDNYPLESIRDLKEPWHKKFIELKGVKYSLDQIENEILRPTFNDPRIHFAINCASVSCPRLNNRAFFDTSLDRMLDQLTRDFLSDKSKNKIGPKEYELSPIFDWFSSDFEKAGGVVKFINRFSKIKIPADATPTFLEYDWGINGK